MSAHAISLHDWVNAFACSMTPLIERIHPSARCICGEYFADMRRAADADDAEAILHLIRLTQYKIADELLLEET